MTPHATILQGDCLAQLRTLPDASVQCCVTSPPYWGLRDYGTGAWEGGDEGCNHVASERYYTEKTAAVASSEAFSQPGEANIERLKNGRWRESGVCTKCGAIKVDKQLGLERTPEEYVAKMVEVFAEVRRVLRDNGTCWINLGDSYAGGGRGGNPEESPFRKQATNTGSVIGRAKDRGITPAGLKPKDLVGIPWRCAFALQAAGWYLRSDIIWAKPNPMPESVTDRPTKSHEYIFLLTKAERYYYDAEAIKEPASPDTHARMARANKGYAPPGQQAHRGIAAPRKPGVNPKADHDGRNGSKQNASFSAAVCDIVENRNKRSVWTVATSPYPEAHFATYPPDLIKPCILAGTKPGDVVLDPFAGSGTTGAVALELGRSALLVELNPAYVELIRQRCHTTPGLALS